MCPIHYCWKSNENIKKQEEVGMSSINFKIEASIPNISEASPTMLGMFLKAFQRLHTALFP